MPTHLSRDTGGVYSIVPTPFDQDGSLDLDSLTRLLEHYSSAGVDGVTVLGQLGEAAKLTPEESRRVVERAVNASDMPVVVGVTAPGYAAMRELTEYSMDVGASGVMIAPPVTLRTDAQVETYYAECASLVSPAPFVLQDYPLRFSVEISSATIARIANANTNLVMLKHEDWPGLDKITDIRSLEDQGLSPRLSIMCGNGGLFLDYELERGADGAMTGYCFPELLVDLQRLTASDRREDAHDLFDAHLPLLRYEQQPGVGLAVRKYILRRRGLLSSDTMRKPRRTLSQETASEVDHLIHRLSRSDTRARV